MLCDSVERGGRKRERRKKLHKKKIDRKINTFVHAFDFGRPIETDCFYFDLSRTLYLVVLISSI